MQTLLDLQKELDAGHTLQNKIGIVTYHLVKMQETYYQYMAIETNGLYHEVREDHKNLEAMSESWGWVFNILESKNPNPVFDDDLCILPGLDFDWHLMPLDGWQVVDSVLCGKCHWSLVSSEVKFCDDCHGRKAFNNLLGDIEIDL